MSGPGEAPAPDPGRDVVASALALAGARKSDLIGLAGPDGLDAMLRLCQGGFQHAELAWRSTSVAADRPRDLLLLVGRMDAETLGDTVKRTGRLLREGGVLVAQLARPEDQAVIAPALAALGRVAANVEASGGLVTARAVRRRRRAG